MRYCGAIVIARDEGKNIRACLESLRKQAVDLFLVVVDDGSLDDTWDVASEYADKVIALPRHEENWAGLPQLASVFNAGFNVLKEKNLDYILISGSDEVYPSTYVSNIISRMEKENIVLCSGVMRGERPSWIPRGSGRVVDAEWFKSIGFKYPLNYGFEAYLVYKALSQGRKIAVFQDLVFESCRGTKLFRKKLYLWGKGMKALNYWWPYAFGRSIIVGIKSPSNGLALMRGYVSKVEQYEDIKEFVPKFQKKIFIRRVVRSLGL